MCGAPAMRRTSGTAPSRDRDSGSARRCLRQRPPSLGPMRPTRTVHGASFSTPLLRGERPGDGAAAVECRAHRRARDRGRNAQDRHPSTYALSRTRGPRRTRVGNPPRNSISERCAGVAWRSRPQIPAAVPTRGNGRAPRNRSPDPNIAERAARFCPSDPHRNSTQRRWRTVQRSGSKPT